MRCLMILSLLLALFVGLPVTPVGADEPVSLESLLIEMTDRTRLAKWPAPAYTCRQASSYDRASTSPEEEATWFANWDRSFFERIEENDGRKEYVLMDVDGPGAVVRFWATWHGPRGKPFSNGTLRFYLDEETTPAIEGPIADILDGGQLIGPPLSQGVSPLTEYPHQAHNLYLPIPYASHCKITYETPAPIDPGATKGGEALYYQINYRTYEPGTRVTSFRVEQLDALRRTIDQTQQRLKLQGPPQLTPQPQSPSGTTGMNSNSVPIFPLMPGKSESFEIEGPRAVSELTVKLDAEDLPQALRSTVLIIEFDGQPTVWCPVGDFFGIGYRMQAHETWYTSVDEDGWMRCRWIMPFAESCRVSLVNVGTAPVIVQQFWIDYQGWTWDERSMHFHATWRQYTKIPTGIRKSMEQRAGTRDLNYVTVAGQGVYVGDTLTIFNGAPAWWGEGDEKIYVDDEAFPSHFGTGTEDYYGYAWCKGNFFAAPFHAQPSGQGNNAPGMSVNSRYRSLDAIPFTRSLNFDMELWHWADTKVNYAPATFFYARPEATCNVAPDPESAALPVAQEMEDVVEIPRIEGAIEGETLKVIESTGGTTEVQRIPKFGWSGFSQLWWIDGKPGDRLVIEFPCEKAGRYKVIADLTKAVDYGIVKLTVGETPAGTFDRYHTSVEHEPLELGTFDLSAGPNRLTVELIGNNPSAIPRGMFGLDYLKVEPVGRSTL